MLLAHGCTLETAQKILRNESFNVDVDRTWDCSQNDTMYAWSVEDVQEGDEESDMHIRMALDSARTSAAIYSNARHVVVFILDVDDDVVELDLSCPNMDYARALYRPHITTKHITQAYVAEFFPRLALFYLTGCPQTMLNLSGLSESEIELINRLADNSSDFTCVDEMDYHRPVTLEELEFLS